MAHTSYFLESQQVAWRLTSKATTWLKIYIYSSKACFLKCLSSPLTVRFQVSLSTKL